MQGWVWVFAVVEHWNAECLGFHVAKTGDRFAALVPVLAALRSLFGLLVKDMACGLLRMDHGCQYTSGYFLQQIRHYGLAASFAFVRQPATNGVVERFFRTLQEQAIHGRTFRDADEVRSAVADFIQRYNASGCVTPAAGAAVPLSPGGREATNATGPCPPLKQGSGNGTQLG
jgi:transposase InsO family protein